MREIPLTQGKVALVDDDYYEWLMQWKWCAVKLSSAYYAVRNSSRRQGNRKFILMHRAILRAEPGREIDHINGNGLDNRRFNLRLCTHAENTYNQRPRVGGTSRFKGVYWDKDHAKWRPQIRVAGRRIHLGDFNNEIEAARAYNEAAIKHFGEFACLNTMEGVS